MALRLLSPGATLPPRNTRPCLETHLAIMTGGEAEGFLASSRWKRLSNKELPSPTVNSTMTTESWFPLSDEEHSPTARVGNQV